MSETEAPPFEEEAAPPSPPPAPEPEPEPSDPDPEPHSLPPHLQDLPKEFFTELNGKPFVLHIGLVHTLHEKSKGRFSIKVTPLKLPTPQDQQAIMQCDLTIYDEKRNPLIEVTEYGDADGGNTNRMVGAHIIRMAVTRATGRAMRLAVDIGLTTADEAGSGAKSGRGQPRRSMEEDESPRRAPLPPRNQQGNAAPRAVSQQNGAPAKAAAAPTTTPTSDKKAETGASEKPFKIGNVSYDRPALIAKYREYVVKANRLGVQFTRVSEQAPMPMLATAAVALSKEVKRKEEAEQTDAAPPVEGEL